MEFILFFIGGINYYLIEILWDGSSHWTMFVLGGLCFVIMGLLNEYKFSWNQSLFIQSLISAVVITVFEFIVGYIVNIKLGLKIWDYSGLPFNLLGQICLYFFLLWILLSLIGIIIDDWIRYIFYIIFSEFFPYIKKREKPHYKLLR